MSIAAAVTGTATTPVHVAQQRHTSPARTTAQRREQSPLNPTSQALRTAGSSPAPTDSARAHIANLDRVLGKPPTVPRPPSNSTHATSKAADQQQEPLNVRHGLLNALNLSTFLPFRGMPAADEMSPRSLAHMQRLLAHSPRPSPRGSIAAEWRRYHGEGAWEGLVDPLDQNLRREVLRYGDFVQAAYAAFHSMPSSSASQLARPLPEPHARAPRSVVPADPQPVRHVVPVHTAVGAAAIGAQVADAALQLRRLRRRLRQRA